MTRTLFGTAVALVLALAAAAQQPSPAMATCEAYAGMAPEEQEVALTSAAAALGNVEVNDDIRAAVAAVCEAGPTLTVVAALEQSIAH